MIELDILKRYLYDERYEFEGSRESKYLREYLSNSDLRPSKLKYKVEKIEKLMISFEKGVSLIEYKNQKIDFNLSDQTKELKKTCFEKSAENIQKDVL